LLKRSGGEPTTVLVPLNSSFTASYRATTDADPAPEDITVRVAASFMSDGALIFFLKWDFGGEEEDVEFAANLDDGYHEAAECYPALSLNATPPSLHFKYPAAVGDKWEYTDVDEGNNTSVQMSVLGVGETHEVLGVRYTDCISYQGLYSEGDVAKHVFKPGVGLIEYIHTLNGNMDDHWERIPAGSHRHPKWKHVSNDQIPDPKPPRGKVVITDDGSVLTLPNGHKFVSKLIETNDRNATLTFANGQVFSAETAKGGFAPPYVSNDETLVATNLHPATQTGELHIFVIGENARYREIPDVNDKIGTILQQAGAPFGTEALRILDLKGRALFVVSLDYGHLPPDGDLFYVVVARDGTLSLGD